MNLNDMREANVSPWQEEGWKGFAAAKGQEDEMATGTARKYRPIIFQPAKRPRVPRGFLRAALCPAGSLD
jgi:hypothetical protein